MLLFFSLLLDESIDKGNIVLIMWCDVNGSDEKVITLRPQSVTAGLFKVLESGLHCLVINEISADICHELVRIGTEGASANIGGSGLKGLVETHVPWIFWMQCMAHCLELAVHDALKVTASDTIDDLLLKLMRSPRRSAGN